VTTAGKQQTAVDASRELRRALRSLRQPAQLQENPLAQTAVVRARAAERYGDDPLAAGRALRDLIVELVNQLDRDLVASGEDPADIRTRRLALRGLARGDGIATVTRSLGIARTSHAARMLYGVHHTLVRRFLERVGHMAPSTQRTAPAQPWPAVVDAVRGVARAG